MIFQRAADKLSVDDSDGFDLEPGFSTEAQGDTLYVCGDIDLYVAGAFRQAGEAHVLAHPSPKIDLTNVAFLDSAGLAALLSIARTARNSERVVRIAAIGNPRRVLRITGVDRMLTIEE